MLTLLPDSSTQPPDAQQPEVNVVVTEIPTTKEGSNNGDKVSEDNNSKSVFAPLRKPTFFSPPSVFFKCRPGSSSALRRARVPEKAEKTSA
jgi:hypothetical protein